MQITGSARVSGAARCASFAPSFVALRHPLMTPDSGGRAWQGLSLLGVQPVRLYVGNNAGNTWVDLAGNDNLTLQAGTPTYNVDGPGPNVIGVKGDGTSYFKGSSGPATGTNDLIVAVALQFPTPAGNYVPLIATRDGGEGFVLFYYKVTGIVEAGLMLGATWLSGTVPATANQTAVFVFTVNRDENSANCAFVFSNAIAGAGFNLSSLAASITDEVPLQIGKGGTISPVTGSIVYAAAVWQGANLFSAGATGAAEMQACASELTQRFFGTYPQKAASGSELLTVTRATESVTEVKRSGVSKYYRMASGAAVVDDEGLEIWGERANLRVYSTDLNQWTKVASTVPSSSEASPGPSNNACKLLADAGDTWHSAFAATSLTDGDRVVASAFFRKGDYRYAGLFFDIAGTAPRVIFDLVAGTSATLSGTPIDKGMVDIGAWWRCFVVGDVVTTASKNLSVALCDSLTVGTLDAAGTEFCVVWCPMIEVGGCMGPPIETAGAAATRNALNIDVDPDNIPQNDVTVTFELKLPAQTTPDANCPTPFDIGTGDNVQRLTMGFAATTGYPYVYTVGGGVASGVINLTAAGNAVDGTWHRYVVALKNGSHTFFKCDDNSLKNAHGLTVGARTQMQVGRSYANGNYINGRIRNVMIYDGYYENA